MADNKTIWIIVIIVAVLILSSGKIFTPKLMAVTIEPGVYTEIISLSVPKTAQAGETVQIQLHFVNIGPTQKLSWKAFEYIPFRYYFLEDSLPNTVLSGNFVVSSFSITMPNHDLTIRAVTYIESGQADAIVEGKILLPQTPEPTTEEGNIQILSVDTYLKSSFAYGETAYINAPSKNIGSTDDARILILDFNTGQTLLTMPRSNYQAGFTRTQDIFSFPMPNRDLTVEVIGQHYELGNYVSDSSKNLLIPLAPTCVDTTWTPLTSTVCLGDSFNQTSNCGTTRIVTGTKPRNTDADVNCDNIISRAELDVYVLKWINGVITRIELGMITQAWAIG